MATRPLNECLNCNSTWHPRGQDLSDQCPRCKSRSVQIVPEAFTPVARADDSSAAVLLVGGGLFLLLLGSLATGVLIFNGRPKADFDQPVAKTNDPIRGEPADERLKTKAKRSDETNPKLVVKSGGTTPIPKESLPPTAPTTPVIPDIPLAPAPRLLPLNRPPMGFVSDWVRCGEIQTRVTGATITRPLLTDDMGNEFRSPDVVLVVWVETRSLPAGRASLRRWFNPLNDYVVLTDADGTTLKAAKLPLGAWLGGQLKGEHSLVPGGAGVTDVLAFQMPVAPTQYLWLKLAGAQVGEQGSFLHKIPREAWSKK